MVRPVLFNARSLLAILRFATTPPRHWKRSALDCGVCALRLYKAFGPVLGLRYALVGPLGPDYVELVLPASWAYVGPVLGFRLAA